MKTARKWLTLILAAVLALGLSAPALAAETNDGLEEIAAAFKALLDQDGIEYEDYGIDYDGDYSIEIYYPSDYIDEHRINFYIDSSGQFFSAYEWYLLDYDAERLDEVLETLNELNLQYRFVTFTADTSDDTITATTYGVIRGDAQAAARVMHYAYDWLPLIVDDAWPVLEELPTVEKDGPEEEAPDFVGTWKFSAMTFTRESGGLPAGTVLTAEDFSNADVFVLEMKENGEFTLASFGAKSEGTWVQDGKTVTLSDDTGDFTAELKEDGTILLDASEDGGYTMTLVRAE